MAMSSKSAISLLIGGAVSLVALYWAFRHVPLHELATYLQSMNYAWIAPAVVIVVLSFVLRVIRWQVLLSASGRIPFWHVFHPLMIGFMVNCVLPGRVGELVRPAILSQKNKIPYPTGLATVVAERIYDTLTLLALLMAVVVWAPINPDARVQFGAYRLSADMLRLTAQSVAALSAVLVLGTVMLSSDRLRGWIQGLIGKIPGVLRRWGKQWEYRCQRWFADPLSRALDTAANGLATIKDPRKVLTCIALSLGNWLLLGLSYYLVALGAPGIGLSYFDLLTVMIIICFFIALPSVPGYWGLWEAGGVFALALFGVSAQPAAGYTLANHGVQVIPVMIIGFCSLWITGVSLRVGISGDGSLARQ